MTKLSSGPVGLHGPTVEYCIRRIVEIPSDFSEQALVLGASSIAVVHDVMETIFAHGRLSETRATTVDSAALVRFASVHRSHRSSECALIVAWLLADPWFSGGQSLFEESNAWLVLTALGARLSEDAPSSAWVGDPVRREELVRSVLAGLHLIPGGESAEQAEDRLAAISSTERRRVLAAAREAERRSADIRAQLAAQAAQEAADKMTRE
jgi:hypothetical protein